MTSGSVPKKVRHRLTRLCEIAGTTLETMAALMSRRSMPSRAKSWLSHTANSSAVRSALVELRHLPRQSVPS